MASDSEDSIFDKNEKEALIDRLLENDAPVKLGSLSKNALAKLAQIKLKAFEEKTNEKREISDSRRWEQYISCHNAHLSDKYKITHEQIVSRARRRAPINPGNNVTDFSGWIYSLYQAAPDFRKLEEGKDIEKEVHILKSKSPAKNSGWEIIYQDSFDIGSSCLKASDLIINGAPMQGKPDVVYRNRSNGNVVIVERKASNATVPDDGWPNLRAQLWVYGQMDEWKNAPKVTLVGEVWGFWGSKPRINRILSWSKSDQLFCDQNQELFDIYKGSADV